MFCPQCGAPNEEEAIYCGECGAVLDAEGAAPVGQHTVERETPEAMDLFDEPGAAVEKEVPPVPARRTTPPPRPVLPTAATRRTSGLAIASLLLGIGGLTILPLLGSIVAIILGYMARAEIRQRPAELEGHGMALAGIILGWIAVGLAILGLVIGIGFGICALLAGFSSGGW
jgi:hypothetical protein